MMVIECDICGFKIFGQQNYCSGCGVDLREPKETPTEKLSEPMIKKKKTDPMPQEQDKKNDDKLRIIKWCWLKSWELPAVLFLISMLASGKSKLGFCECATCNQGYREFMAISENSSGKKLKASSREIVKKARQEDITGFTLDIADLLKRLGSHDDNKANQETTVTPMRNTTVNEGKILLEIDESVIEFAIIKVLSSDKGQQIIKNAKAPQKKKSIRKK
jgi:hypothetical protein